MDIDAGSLVYSIAGRDKGGVFVVLSLSDMYCYLADGKIRKTDNPKKKKQKHLKATGHTADALKEKITSGERPTNSEVRRAIAAYLDEADQKEA